MTRMEQPKDFPVFKKQGPVKTKRLNVGKKEPTPRRTRTSQGIRPVNIPMTVAEYDELASRMSKAGYTKIAEYAREQLLK